MCLGSVSSLLSKRFLYNRENRAKEGLQIQLEAFWFGSTCSTFASNKSEHLPLTFDSPSATIQGPLESCAKSRTSRLLRVLQQVADAADATTQRTTMTAE